jgi:D-3-phosphoglycerate dehydrogenase
MAPKKTSYPKQDIKVLLLEGISPNAVETFRAAGYSNIVTHAKSLPEDELRQGSPTPTSSASARAPS